MNNITSVVSGSNLAQGRTTTYNLKTEDISDNIDSDFLSTINQQANSFIDYSLRNVPTGRNSVTSNTLPNYNINSNNSYINNDLTTNEIIESINASSNSSTVNTEIRVKINAKDEATKQRISNAVKVASKKYNVDPNLILAVMQKESSFNPNATSKSGARGLMQIMPSNLKYLGVKNAYNIEENIDGGTKLLKEYLDKYNGNVEMALMAYNGGPTNMAKRGVKSANDLYKMPSETQKYVPAVMKIYKGE